MTAESAFGLERLIVRLDETERWDKQLSADEEQRLALTRLLLHAPSWVLFEEATLCANEAHCRLLRSILTTEFADAAVIAIAGNPALKGFYTRTLHFRPHAAVASAVRPAAAAGTTARSRRRRSSRCLSTNIR